MSETLAEAPEADVVDTNDDVPVESIDLEAPQTGDVETEAVAPPAPDVDVREMQAELEYTRSQLERVVGFLQSQPQPGAPAPEVTAPVAPPDPFSDNYAEEFAAWNAANESRLSQTIGQTIQQALAQFTQPIQQAQEQARIEEGEQQMRDVIADLGSREGELLGDSPAKKMAEARIIQAVRERHFPEVAQRYGETNRAAELAIERAYREEREYQQSIVTAHETQRQNRNATLAGQRSEPQGTSGVQTSSDEILPEGALARRYAADARRVQG